MLDLNRFDEEFVVDLAGICFPKRFGTTVLDWGCASGRWVKVFQELGYNACGFDLKVEYVGIPHLFEADIRTYTTKIKSDFSICTSVLIYFSLEEIKEILTRFYDSFSKSAYIFTPDSTMQPFYPDWEWGGVTHTPKSFPDVRWLRDICEGIGGSPVIMNFINVLGTQTGPAILWIKDIPHPPSAWAAHVSNLYRSYGYAGFTVSV